jgi:hypothetical protein
MRNKGHPENTDEVKADGRKQEGRIILTKMKTK